VEARADTGRLFRQFSSSRLPAGGETTGVPQKLLVLDHMFWQKSLSNFHRLCVLALLSERDHPGFYL
jgi:hypothetical protein